MTTLETKTILITVKAYPSPSRKYGETVCCAGIDIDTARWIRLYPIPFRDLDTSQKFKEYTIIRVRCRKAPDDHRPESYKVDSDSIEKLAYLDTKQNWLPGKRLFCPRFPSHSVTSSRIILGKADLSVFSSPST